MIPKVEGQRYDFRVWGLHNGVALVEDLRTRTKVFGSLNTLENLKKDGRIGGAAVALHEGRVAGLAAALSLGGDVHEDQFDRAMARRRADAPR